MCGRLRGSNRRPCLPGSRPNLRIAVIPRTQLASGLARDYSTKEERPRPKAMTSDSRGFEGFVARTRLDLTPL